MDDNLFPEEIDEPSDDIAEDDDEEEVIGYKKAPYFDSRIGDFVTDGHGKVLTADGVAAWTHWCENVLATDRYNHEAYTDDVGIDYDEIFKNTESREEIETLLETEITDALLCDPYGRTKYVQAIEFDWVDSDSVNVSIEAVGMDNELVTIDTLIVA